MELRGVGRTLLVVLFSGVFLTARTFVSPRTPVLLGGDQGFFWEYGERLRAGAVPYRDFFQFTLPGADVVHALVFALFGARVAVTCALVVAVGMALAAALFWAARAVLSDRDAALATAAFVVLDFGEALTSTHHSFSELFILLAVGVVVRGEGARRLAVAGAFLGAATFCTQSHGVAAAVAVCVFVARRARPWWVVLVAYVATLAGLLAWFVKQAGPRAVVDCVFGHVLLNIGASMPGLALPEDLTLRSLPALAPHLVVYALVPVAYVVARPRSLAREAVGAATLVWMVGVTTLAEVLASFSWVRLFAVAWPAFVLGVRALRGRLGVAAWASIALVGLALVRSTGRHHARLVALPGGPAATDDANAEELEWLLAHVPPGSALFAGDRPSLYLPLGLEAPIYLDASLPTAQTTVAHAERAAREIARLPVGWVVWSAALEDASARPGGEGLRVLQDELEARFVKARAFTTGDEVWTRRGESGP